MIKKRIKPDQKHKILSKITQQQIFNCCCVCVCVCVADSDMLKRQPPKSHVGLLRDNHNPQSVRPMESFRNSECKPTASYLRFVLHQR